MVHPFKGHNHKRYIERKDPYYSHFVGYHAFLNPDIVFRERVKNISSPISCRRNRLYTRNVQKRYNVRVGS